MVPGHCPVGIHAWRSTRCCRFSLAVRGSPPYRVLFFGTDDVSLATLEFLHANSTKNEQDEGRLIEHIEVVCPSDRPVNGCKKDEPVPVKRFAQRSGLKVFDTPPHLKSLKTWDFPVTDWFDVGVVVSFGYFLHPNMLNNLHYGAINMHPSLLPKYRGPAPIQHALLNGDATTGVSVIEIDPKAFDVGRTLLQTPYDIKPGIQCQEYGKAGAVFYAKCLVDNLFTPLFVPNRLTKELAALGADSIMRSLANLPARKKEAIVQDDTCASTAPKLVSKDGHISFDDPATVIFHRWQALSNSVGVTVQFREKVVKLIEVRLPTTDELQVVRAGESCNEQATAGTFFFEKQRQVLWLRCAGDSWLLISKLQQAGRKVGSALDFCNGYRLKSMQREQFEEVTAGPVVSKL